MSERVPSPSQLQALEDIESHGDPYKRVHGQSRHGGWFRVMLVIEHRAKWGRFDGRRRKWVLTPAGKLALRRARQRRQRTALVARRPDPYVTAKLAGVLIVHEAEVRAKSVRYPLDQLLERMGDRRVSVLVTSLDPPPPGERP